VDLARYVGADLERIRQDVITIRPNKPTIYTNLRTEEGASDVFARIRSDALFGLEVD
jgi:urease accessory protein